MIIKPNHKCTKLTTVVLATSLAISFFGLSGCETNDALGRSQFLLVDNQDLAPSALLGWAELVKTSKISRDPVMNARVRAISQRIISAAGFNPAEWEVVLFENEQPNAFVIPGNKVGVNTGMFKVAKNDDQLAAVIGHETAHVIGKHAAERYSQQAGTQIALTAAAGATSGRTQQIISNYGGMGAQLGFLLPYSRQHELEADRLGVDIMVKAGYRATEAIALWRNMSAQGKAGTLEMMSTHPSDSTRIAALEAYIQSKGYK
jgi:predicted Zn-dependent protease